MFRYILNFIVALLLILFGLAAVEGLASVGLFTRDAVKHSRALHGREEYSQFDKDLGWAHIPNSALKDFPFPGADITINSHGFRGLEDYELQIPEGKTRAICSGDSFTFGYGVSDNETWCAYLRKELLNTQTINMGQAGYGVDQVYLWYMRDGKKFAADYHVLAFVSYDLQRMLQTRRGLYQKPRFRLNPDFTLRLDNSPVVPTRAYKFPWLLKNSHLFQQLRFYRFLGEYLPLPHREQEEQRFHRDQSAFSITLKLIEQLNEHQKNTGVKFLVVYLPVLGEYNGPLEWTADEWFGAKLKRRGIPFLNLVSEFRFFEPQQAGEFFIANDRHPTAKGHRWFAKRIGEALKELPPV